MKYVILITNYVKHPENSISKFALLQIVITMGNHILKIASTKNVTHDVLRT